MRTLSIVAVLLLAASANTGCRRERPERPVPHEPRGGGAGGADDERTPGDIHRPREGTDRPGARERRPGERTEPGVAPGTREMERAPERPGAPRGDEPGTRGGEPSHERRPGTGHTPEGAPSPGDNDQGR
jgi:hypothetical protein